MRDAHIAEQMGIKRAYFSQVVNGLPVTDATIDRMCSAFGFKFPPAEQVAEYQTPKGMVLVSAEMWEELVLQVKTSNRLIGALLDREEKRAAP